jgi:hypothetical protein
MNAAHKTAVRFISRITISTGRPVAAPFKAIAKILAVSAVIIRVKKFIYTGTAN